MSEGIQQPRLNLKLTLDHVALRVYFLFRTKRVQCEMLCLISYKTSSSVSEQLSYRTAMAMEERAHPRVTFLKHICREAPPNTVQILVHKTLKDMFLKNKF